jgi:hypothetical protein
MTLNQLLQVEQEQIISEAAEALLRARLTHYNASSVQKNLDRLDRLYRLTAESVSQRQLVPISNFARQVARERFSEGFDLQEVQAAFNVLEETIWRHITTGLAPSDYPEAFGLISTVLGAGKEALAVEYVLLAAQQRVLTLNLAELFKGT